MSDLTHYDETGRVRMVDVSAKAESHRTASASATLLLSPETLKRLNEAALPKGDPLEIARIAGIMAAKKTSELIPLCHQLNLTKADVKAKITDLGIDLISEVVTDSKTGVEMEALTAVSVAALTVYDMLKAVQRDIVISDIRLLSKTGGRADYFSSDAV